MDSRFEVGFFGEMPQNVALLSQFCGNFVKSGRDSIEHARARHGNRRGPHSVRMMHALRVDARAITRAMTIRTACGRRTKKPRQGKSLPGYPRNYAAWALSSKYSFAGKMEYSSTM